MPLVLLLAGLVALDLLSRSGNVPTTKDLIVGEFIAAGYSLKVGKAAVVNAYRESALNPSAVGDSGHSIGLFQEYDKGAGKGIAPELLKDPILNTARIIVECNRYGDRLVEADKAGATVAELAVIFMEDIERPADKVAEAARCKTIAEQLYPGE